MCSAPMAIPTSRLASWARFPPYPWPLGYKLGCKHDGSGITRMAEVALGQLEGTRP